MRTPFVFGVVLIALGVLVAVTPHGIAPVCEYFGKFMETSMGTLIPMKCHYTAYSEIGVGVTVAALGAVMMATKGVEARRSLGAMGIVLGVIVILLPTYLTGLCMNPDMPCRIATGPALTALGAAVVVVSGVGIFAFRKPSVA